MWSIEERVAITAVRRDRVVLERLTRTSLDRERRPLAVETLGTDAVSPWLVVAIGVGVLGSALGIARARRRRRARARALR